MKSTIYIKGEIVENTLQKVKDQVKPNTTEIEININSEGGLVDTTLDIIDFLLGLNVPIKTFIDGECSSSATLISLIPSNKEDRQITKESHYLIHCPFISDDKICVENMCTADFLNYAGDVVKFKEELFLDAYESKTGINRETLKEIMDNNDYISADKAQSLNFVTIKDNKTIMAKKKIKGLNIDLDELQYVIEEATELTLEGLKGKKIKAVESGEALEDGEYQLNEDIAVVVESGEIVDVILVEEMEEASESVSEEVSAIEGEEVEEESVEITEDQLQELIDQLDEEKQAEIVAKLTAKRITAVKSYTQPKINLSMKKIDTSAVNGKPQFKDYALSVLASRGARYKNGKLVISANAVAPNFNYTYNGVEDLNNLFYKKTLGTPDITKMFDVRYNVKSGQQLFSVNSMSKVVKKSLGNCDTSLTGTGSTLVNKKLTTVELVINLEECADIWDAKITEFWLNSGVEKGDLTGTEVESIILNVVNDAIRRDWFRILSFGDISRVSTDYNQLDGLWATLLDGETAGEVIKADTITALNIANATANGEYYLRNLVQEAPFELRGLLPEETAIYVTQNLYDNYLNMLEAKNATESAFRLLTDGQRVLTFRGIEVVPVPMWDTFAVDSGLTANTLALYTTKMNNVVGVDGDNDQYVKFFYDMRSDKNYVRAKFKLGYQYQDGKLACISYGTV